MNGMLKFSIASIISTCLALSLTILIAPHSPQLPETRNGVAVLTQSIQTDVQQQQLINVLAALPLHVSIDKVDQNQTVLSLDLISGGDIQSALVYEDLFQLVDKLMVSTPDIHMLLIRLMEKKADGSEALLMAMSASRAQLPGNTNWTLDRTSAQMEQMLKAHFSFTFTALWNEKF